MTATSKPAVSAGERYWRWTLNLALAVTLARLLWLRFGNTDLYPDEAQYWLWSLHPALGYYSKPPLVAWLIALTTSVLGDGEASIRLAAPLLHFATSLVVYRIGARLYDPRTGFWAALAYVTLPGVSVSAALISTDAPLLLAWAAALYAFIRAREPGGRRWWILVGAAAGLGLLAKFAMAYWLISAALYIAFFAGERRHWKGYAGALALALVIYAPNFLWNLGHGFVSYRHTEENAVSHGPLLNPSHFAEFFFSQFGVFGPMFFACLLVIVLRPRRDLAPRPNALLAMFALPTLGMMLAVSFLSHAQPNWAAPAYVSAIVLVAAWLLKQQRQAWLLAGAHHANFSPLFQVDHAHRVRSAVGHISAMSGSIDIDEVRQLMHGDGGDHAVRLGVDDRDRAGEGVDHVHLVALRVRCHARRLAADLQCAVLPHVD